MKYIPLLLLCLLASCAGDSRHKSINVEKNVVDITEKIHPIDFGDTVLFNAFCKVDIAKDYLIVSDYKNYENQVHLFDKNNFHYLASTAPLGQGPGEITTLGGILINEDGSELYVQDFARYQFFAYNPDSIRSNPEYKPTLKWNMDRDIFAITLQMLNDTASVGLIGMPVSASEINMQTGFWNMETNEIRLLNDLYVGEEHTRYDVKASVEHNLIVEAHWYLNRIVLRRFDGTELCRIEGATDNWQNMTDYYRSPLFVGSNIYLLYYGRKYADKDKRNYTPTKIVILDLEGNYLKTLDMPYYITSWCYDEDNRRIILNMNEEVQFGYLEVEDI